MKKIVFIVPTLWAGLNQRHHHFASIFKEKGYDVQVVDFSSRLSSFYIGTLQKKLHVAELEIPHKRHTYKAMLPSFVLQKKESNWKNEREKFSNFLKKLSGEVFTTDTILWLQGISIFYDPETILNLPKKLLISDVEDDYAGFVRSDLEKEILRIEREVVRKADMVFTSAQTLLDRLEKENDQSFLILNGVDEKLITSSTGFPRPKDMPSGIIVGYHGVIADWFDFDLMYKVAQRLEKEKIIILGRQFVSFNKEKFKKLTGRTPLRTCRPADGTARAGRDPPGRTARTPGRGEVFIESHQAAYQTVTLLFLECGHDFLCILMCYKHH